MFSKTTEVMEKVQKLSKLSIMQPYLFPYLGYFQLINATDTIVFCDDVAFIKNGWIGKNRILTHNGPLFFSVPLEKRSSNKLIKDTLIDNGSFAFWRKKFLNTLRHAYLKSPNFDPIYTLVEKVIHADLDSISKLAVYSVESVFQYLELDLNYKISSEICIDCVGIDKVDRIVNLSEFLGYKEFVNPIGGIELYDKEVLKARGIDLYFIKPKPFTYEQFNGSHVPWLSIIDLLMFLDKEEVVKRFSEYELV